MTLELHTILDGIASLSDRDLGFLRSHVNALWESRVMFYDGLTDDEANMGILDATKAVRNRTGLSLRDSKELVERWRARVKP